MVHFGSGTPQNSVAEILCMSSMGQALRATLHNDAEAHSPLSLLPLAMPHRLQISSGSETALLHAIRIMVKYRTEKRPAEHAYKGRALFWHLNAFCEPHNVTYATKLSYIKSAVKRGPVGVAETK